MDDGSRSRRLAVCGFAAALLLADAAGARAQSDAPAYELFGGYAYLRDVAEDAASIPVGWNASIARSFGRSWGVVLDLGGHYKSEEGADVSEHSLLAGTRYSFRGEKLTPYLEALVGGVRLSSSFAGESFSDSELAVQTGLGLGFKLSDSMSLRTGLDFRNIFAEGESLQQLRIVAGLSFGLGGRSEPPPSSGSRRLTPSPPSSTVPGPELGSQPALPLPPPQAPAPRRPALEQEPAKPETLGLRPPVAPPESGALARGRELLTSGDYAQAADAFGAHLRLQASDRFTIAVGLYCDASNVAALVRDAGGAEAFLLLRAPRRGPGCYGIYWGLFRSRQEAQQALGSVPSALRAAGQAPIPVYRLLR